eukprot:scaffold849_cov386-Prasinococcus_capsulatus_cf.AAC.6
MYYPPPATPATDSRLGQAPTWPQALSYEPRKSGQMGLQTRAPSPPPSAFASKDRRILSPAPSRQQVQPQLTTPLSGCARHSEHATSLQCPALQWTLPAGSCLQASHLHDRASACPLGRAHAQACP